jgi:FLVCR family MFS transporter 7
MGGCVQYRPRISITANLGKRTVKSDNAPALFIIFGLIGICMMPMLPVGLELAVEVTRNAEASSATLFGLGNGTGVILLAIEDALRAGPTADPPRNMKTGLIFQGVLILVITLLGLGIRGTQMRRINDEAEARDGGKVEMDAMDDPKA